MPVGKATALAAALLASMALGAWVGPLFTGRAQAFGDAVPAAPVRTVAAPVDPVPERAEKPTPRIFSPHGRARARPSADAAISLSTPKLRKQLKPLLNDGADMDAVASGFRSAEDLAATVHAARNTKVPFLVLKHHVVDERQTLAAAIRIAKPAADASLEADLARSEARADLAAIK